MANEIDNDFVLAKREAQVEHDDARKKLFLPVGAQVSDVDTREGDGDGPPIVDEIESLCMSCEENGMTRMLLTEIPNFREVILMSFYCEHCHFKNTEVQSASEIQKLGTKYTLTVNSVEDMQRQIVKADTSVIRIEEIELEVPAGRGRLTNIEGILSDILKDLEASQTQRKTQDPAVYEQLVPIINKLIDMMVGKMFPYTITLDDIAGNSWIEASPIDTASKYTRKDYPRTPEQNASLGLSSSEPVSTTNQIGDKTGPLKQIGPDKFQSLSESEGEKSMDDVDIMEGHMYTMPCECPGCTKPAAMNMQMVNVPYFKQVIITAVNCMYCDYRTNEVKTGGAVPPQGRRITLRVKNAKDLGRDILKSDTCLLKIPECAVDVQPGTMGGRFTTLEGLLTQIRDDLRSQIFDVGSSSGDSLPSEQKQAWDKFFSQLEKAIAAEIEFTIELEDPLANSYVQSFHAPEPDPQLSEEDYDRTEEEEDDLGLLHMKTVQNEHGEYVREEASERPGRVEDDRTQGDATEKNKWGHFIPETESDNPSGVGTIGNTETAGEVKGDDKSDEDFVIVDAAKDTISGQDDTPLAETEAATLDKLAAATSNLGLDKPSVLE